MAEETPSPSTTTLPEFPNFFNLSAVLDENVQFEQFGVFFKSIEWGEPWIIGLILFHIMVTLMTILSHRRATAQGLLFLFMLTLIFLSEKLNRIAAENWQLFSRHQYFDSNGMFISIVFSLPLLFNCMIMVANWLMISSELMTSIRKFQLQQQNARNARNDKVKKDGGSGSPQREGKTAIKKEKHQRNAKKSN